MVVGHDVAVLTDYDTRSAALDLPGLRCAFSEEETEERIVDLVLLGGCHFNIYDRLDSSLCSIGQVRIIGLCQIDSPGNGTILHQCRFFRLTDVRRLDDAVSCQYAQKH